MALPFVLPNQQQAARVLSALDANGIVVDDAMTATPQMRATWNFLNEPDAVEHLNAGRSFFKFMCCTCSSCSAEDLHNIQMLINVSSFSDEQVENNCPIVYLDGGDQDELGKYVVIVVKSMYLLPGVQAEQLTPEFMSTIAYNEACQPGRVTFQESEFPNTIRFSKTIIPFIYAVTIQFKVSEITDPTVLKQLFTDVDGIVPVKCIFLERTKRNIQNVDATAKVRSVLLYYSVAGGLLVSHTTVVLNTSLPGFVAKVVNNFGGQGAAESAETADKTRRHLLGTLGDARAQ